MRLLARLYLRGRDSASPPWCADCGTVLCRGVEHGADDCARATARFEAGAALGDPWARKGAMPAPVKGANWRTAAAVMTVKTEEA